MNFSSSRALFMILAVMVSACSKSRGDRSLTENPRSESPKPNPEVSDPVSMEAPRDMGAIKTLSLSVGWGDGPSHYLFLTPYESNRNDGFMRFEPSTKKFSRGNQEVQVSTVYLHAICRGSKPSCGVLALPSQDDLELVTTDTLSDVLNDGKFVESESLTSLDSMIQNPDQQIFVDGTVWLVRREAIDLNPQTQKFDVPWIQTIALKINRLDLQGKKADFSYRVIEYRKK